MANEQIIYEIDDSLSTDQNMAVFAQKISELDPILGPVLANHLGAIGDGQPDVPTILAALEATLVAPANPSEGES